MISQERSLAPTESATGQEQPHRAPGKRTLTMAIQRRATAVAPETGRQAAAALPSVDPVDDPFGLHLLGGGGVPLPGHLRERFEASLGVDLGGVRLNTGADSSAAATGLSARAFALGQDIHFGAGELDLTSAAGLELLAHEVAHTVQQGRGGHGPQEKLEVSEPGDACELEADRAAAAMLAGEPTQVTSYSGAARKVMRDVTADARATIVGHASPRWDAPRGATPAQRNQELSTQRAQEVERFFREIMTRELRRRAVAAHITAAASGVLDEDRQNVPPASVSEGYALHEPRPGVT